MFHLPHHATRILTAIALREAMTVCLAGCLDISSLFCPIGRTCSPLIGQNVDSTNRVETINETDPYALSSGLRAVGAVGMARMCFQMLFENALLPRFWRG